MTPVPSTSSAPSTSSSISSSSHTSYYITPSPRSSSPPPQPHPSPNHQPQEYLYPSPNGTFSLSLSPSDQQEQDYAEGEGEEEEYEEDADSDEPPMLDQNLLLNMDEEMSASLSTLDKTFLFARSEGAFHRVWICRSLPLFLNEISPADARDYVVPLLNELSRDSDESVREAFVTELVPIMWWFLTNCQISPLSKEEILNSYPQSIPALLSHTTFTQILLNLLVSLTSPTVALVSRLSVVEIFKRIYEKRTEGLFGEAQMTLLEKELVEGVVLGLSRMSNEHGPGEAEGVEVAADAAVVEQQSPTVTGSPLAPPFERPPHPEPHSPLSAVSPASSPFERPSLLMELPSPPSDPPPSPPSLHLDVTPIPQPPHPTLQLNLTPKASQLPLPSNSPELEYESPPLTNTRPSPSPIQTSSPPTQPSSSSSVPETSLSPSTPSTPSLISGSSGSISSNSSNSVQTQKSEEFETNHHTPVPPPFIVLPQSPPQEESRNPNSDDDFLTAVSPGFSSSNSDSSSASRTPTSPRSFPASSVPSPSLTIPATVSPPDFFSSDSESASRTPISPGSEPTSSAPSALPPIPTSVSPPSPASIPTVSSPPPSFSIPTPPLISPLGPLPTLQFSDPVIQSNPWGVSTPYPGTGNPMDSITHATPSPAVSVHDEWDDEMDRQVAGRVACMSLIAAVAAKGVASEEAKVVFKDEAVRLAQDSVHWVRREAAYALGALAKVVPENTIVSSLLPLYENLTGDPTWDVRHSSIFALPSLLSRLTPEHRRSLAINQVRAHATDSSQSVRSGLLEVLGEMIYVFKGDERGPPGELINLFVGDPDMWDREASLQGTEEQTAAKESTVQSAYDEFFLDPERPLICAFNFPAVTATLGRERWSELRDYYHFLSRDQHRKVRLTLGASLGEIAKIVGPDNAVLDVLPLWWNCVKHEDPDVRLKVVSAECLKVLLDALDKETKLTMMQGLKDVWVENLTGWKEREALAGVVKDLVVDLGEDGRDLWELILKALEDDVAIIREYAITAVPVFLKIHGSSKPAANLFLHDLDRLCQSTSFRRRATYVACCQALILAEDGLKDAQKASFWERLAILAEDPIIDVRIGVSRLVGNVCSKYPDSSSLPPAVAALARVLARDWSYEVRSYVLFLTHPVSPARAASALSRNDSPTSATFSRPPPTTPLSEGPPLGEFFAILEQNHAHSPETSRNQDLRAFEEAIMGKSSSSIGGSPLIHQDETRESYDSPGPRRSSSEGSDKTVRGSPSSTPPPRHSRNRSGGEGANLSA